MVICPTITATNLEDYQSQIDRIKAFASQIHIDIMDGVFVPTHSPDLTQVYWPDNILVAVHMMNKQPANYLEDIKKLKPHEVIIHAEADVDHKAFALLLHNYEIKAGLALLPDTSVASVANVLESFDQVLIFGGHLGYQGGNADLSQLSKVKEIKNALPQLEVAWDGGINDENIVELYRAGIEVFNVGSFIQASSDPRGAYAKLWDRLRSV